MTCGIYKLSFKNTDKVYIGQAVNINRRYTAHIGKLKHGTHTTKMMQAYRAFGLPTLQIILECNQTELDDCENEVIEIFNSVDNGFNTLATAESLPYGKSNWGENSGRSKYSNEQIIQVFKKMCTNPTKPLTEISEESEVSYAIIAHISSGSAHSWLSEVFPEEYENMLNTVRGGSRNSAKFRGIIYPKIKSPEGVVYQIDYLNSFCKEHNLDSSTLSKVLKGARSHHKKWVVA